MADFKNPHETISKDLEQLHNTIRTLPNYEDRNDIIKALIAQFYQRFITPQMEVKETIVILYDDDIKLSSILTEAASRTLAGLLGLRDAAHKPKEVVTKTIDHIARYDPTFPIVPACNPKFVTNPHIFLILACVTYPRYIKMRSILRGQLNGFSTSENRQFQTKDDQPHGWSSNSKEHGMFFEGLKNGKWRDKGEDVYYIDDVKVSKEVYDKYIIDTIKQASEHSTISLDPLSIVRGYLF